MDGRENLHSLEDYTGARTTAARMNCQREIEDSSAPGMGGFGRMYFSDFSRDTTVLKIQEDVHGFPGGRAGSVARALFNPVHSAFSFRILMGGSVYQRFLLTNHFATWSTWCTYSSQERATFRHDGKK